MSLPKAKWNPVGKYWTVTRKATRGYVCGVGLTSSMAQEDARRAMKVNARMFKDAKP
jgi:hypothetical protein